MAYSVVRLLLNLTVVVSNHNRWVKVIWVSLLLYNVYLIVCVSDIYIDNCPSGSIYFLSRLCGSWKSWSKMALDKILLFNQGYVIKSTKFRLTNIKLIAYALYFLLQFSKMSQHGIIRSKSMLEWAKMFLDITTQQ